MGRGVYTDKFQAIVIYTRNHLLKGTYKFKIDSYVIDSVQFFILIVMHFDNKINFQEHESTLCIKH